MKKFRIGLSRLRISSHRLAIESVRWREPTRNPLEERLCYMCNTLEDECHFVLECPAQSEFRCKYEGCSNMNASRSIIFVLYMLRQNVIPFWKELSVAFKMAPNI